ncbi:DUF664 domain-containing protein [Streptomyces sp. NPDC049097]|uniref:mycothiol transferase n=1 Tax=Streptomyces sp. NPDC049097 TaxID=3155497 RepID=UPI00342A4CBA
MCSRNDSPGPRWPGRQRSLEIAGRVCLRWTLVHTVEEYTRHTGHADLIRSVSTQSSGREAGSSGREGPPPCTNAP